LTAVYRGRRNAIANAPTLYQQYKTWCDANSERRVNTNRFAEYLIERGAKKEIKKNRSWYTGIKLREDLSQTDGRMALYR